mmetsp:Transcript_15415/g.24215  ORF Transcript_15415/g.24215 Transcript_15415/m.24215 type:complete len:201 (+) Transcript_15415:244-846(+)
MAVDGAVIHIDLVVIGDIHQLVAALDETGALRQRLQQQEFRDGQRHVMALPADRVAQRVHLQMAAFDHLGFLGIADDLSVHRVLAAQQRADPLDQKALAERLLDIVIRPHAQAQHLVDLIVLGGQEDHRHRRLLPQPLQQIHPVHAGHLDIQNGHVRQLLAEGIERLLAVIIRLHLETFRFERHRDRSQNVAIIVHEGDL